ncbi:MAG TPA: GNAT family N-acetyltransferase [Saprospiraceae bacterium]|nr:GNAT family N-acetyltransferase [Saprospiraceae bacterium]HNT20964.1 GNAT family N-acetyltransferase [Saprospiraceae bacterium]
MIPTFNPGIRFALPADAASIVALLNSAYRGEGSKQGWTTEAHLIAGDRRTDIPHLIEIMARPDSVFLVYQDGDGPITACVNLQRQGNKLYLGMFSVSPQMQGKGIGKQLLKAADEYARHLGCTAIYMSVISVRDELIRWYQRHGYKDTGERKPFVEDGLTGKHLRPLEFMTLEKEVLSSPAPS